MAAGLGQEQQADQLAEPDPVPRPGRRDDAADPGAAQVSLSLVESPSGRPDVELIAREGALVRLAALDQRKSRVVELKFFGGLIIEEIAEVLQVSGATVERE